jgi:hypothetical protein
MKKWMKLAVVALFTACVACFSSAAPVTILNTEFTSPYTNGDLAGQQAWQAVVGTLGDGTNAYTVTDASGTGYATTRQGSLLSVTNGNFVYLTNAIPNVKSNDLAGSLDFVVESTVNSLGGFDFLHIGLSSTKTNKLDPTAAEDAYLSLATSPGGDINVRWKDGDPSAGGVSTLIFQMPAEAMTWTVTSTNMTSPRLRLNWKIRKSNYLNTYLITASMTNLDASINQVSGIAAAARPTAYNAGTNYFLMGQPAEAYSSNKFSTTEIWIDKMSITNTADAAAVLSRQTSLPMRSTRWLN